MATIHLTKDTFDSIALSGDKPVLVVFYADWCGPCKSLSPVVEEISEESDGYVVCKLNVDDAAEIAARYGVMSIPTLIAFKDGRETGKLVGVQSKQAILGLIK